MEDHTLWVLARDTTQDTVTETVLSHGDTAEKRDGGDDDGEDIGELHFEVGLVGRWLRECVGKSVLDCEDE